MENNAIFRPEWFEAYQLDVKKNFLKAPLCGCGGKLVAELKSEEKMKEFMFAALADVQLKDHEKCGIFAHAITGKLYAAIKGIDGDKSVRFLKCNKDNEITAFKHLDEAFRLNQYALIVENNVGEWKIIEC